MLVRQSGATTFHLKDSDDWFLHTSAGQEFQRTLPFCQDELEHLRHTWASLSQWSEWCLHTGNLSDVSLARNVLECNDGQPALPPLFWALVHQLLHQRGLDNDDTSEEKKAVICLGTAIAVCACLEWQCSLCAVYAHSRQPILSQDALMHPSITPRHVDIQVFTAGSTKYDSQSVSTCAEDFLHTRPQVISPHPSQTRQPFCHDQHMTTDDEDFESRHCTANRHAALASAALHAMPALFRSPCAFAAFAGHAYRYNYGGSTLRGRGSNFPAFQNLRHDQPTWIPRTIP